MPDYLYRYRKYRYLINFLKSVLSLVAQYFEIISKF